MISTSRIVWFVRHAGRQIWFRAALISLASVVVAGFAGIIARAIPYEFTGDIGQNAIGTVLEIIASSMLAVTTFSLTAMVSAYSSATQLATPRATQLMISDRTSQNALSTFLGAFIFSVVGVIGLQTRLYGGQGRVVLLLATVLLIVLVVVTLLRWIAHLAAFGRMADVIDRVEDAACKAMRAFAKDPYQGGRPAVAVPPGSVPVVAESIGYVTHIDVPALAAIATKHEIAVHVASLPGTLVHDGRPLLYVAGGNCNEATRRALVEAFMVERHRRFDHDPRLGLIALGEIAGRALAPATNDPGTAIEVVNALFRTLSLLPAETPPPDAALPLVYLPRPEAGEMIRDGFAPIVREGAGEEEAAMRALKVLAALGDALPHAAATTRALTAELRRNVERTMQDDAAIARTLEQGAVD